jgi:hypothetical protein
MNSYTMETPISAFTDGGFVNLARQFGGLTAYSYVFNGESGYLDHALASPSLAAKATGVGHWHINPDEPTVLDYNTEFKTANQVNTFYDPGPYRSSDHDPVVIGFQLNSAPTVAAGGPYTVAEGSSTTLSATGNDPDGDTLAYAWDLDGNGTFETAGQSVSFSADDGPASATVTVRATDGAATTTAQAVVTVTNVPPTATFTAPGSASAGFPFTLSLGSVVDRSAADTSAGFDYAFDCGSGYGAFGATASASCSTADTGARSVGAKVRDKDGGISAYRATVAVVVSYDSLCALVRSYARRAQDADALCAKLADAAGAPTPEIKAGVLKAFRNQVDAKTGAEPAKSFTAEQAALLKLLSTRL